MSPTSSENGPALARTPRVRRCRWQRPSPPTQPVTAITTSPSSTTPALPTRTSLPPPDFRGSPTPRTEPPTTSTTSSEFTGCSDANNLPAVSIPEGAGVSRMRTPATPTRWTSRTSSSTPSTPSNSRRTGPPRRSSSPTTTPTAGTITYAADRQPVQPARRRRLTGPGACGVAAPGAHPGRCGYGARLPLLVSRRSPRQLRRSTITDQTSILQVHRGQLVARQTGQLRVL